MTTETQERVALVATREKLRTGMPTSGLFILVGLPKSGKTTLAAAFPGSYVLELERAGGDRVAGRIHDVLDLAMFREVLPVAMREPAIKTIVIDSVDVLSDWIEDEIAKSKGLQTISERKAGVDGFEIWAEYRKRIEGMVGYLRDCGKLIILIAHCKDPKLDNAGGIVTPAGINMPGKAGGFLAAQADMIGYCYKRVVGPATTYVLTFQGGPLGVWGSRVEELNDKTITLDRKNPYGSFEAVFTGAVQPQAAPQSAPEAAPAGWARNETKGKDGKGRKSK